MTVVRRGLFLAVVSGLVFPTAAMATPAAPPACAHVAVRGLGDTCLVLPQGYQVEADLGTGLLVHGNDALSTADEPATAAAPRPPVCAPAGTHRMIVVYARPIDASNRFEDRLGAIRNLVADANGLLHQEARTRGATADYRVACTSSGAVEVRHEVLPTPGTGDSFNTVVGDLRAKGYTSITDKVWVWYEGSVGAGIAGTGHVYWDESRSVNNKNNAGTGTTSTFAITWGAAAGYSVRTWMHENAHNLGAVQMNAPDSSGYAHCTDGQDVMCYADGGNYNPEVCTDRMHFDCGKDTYFNPDPVGGSYLATQWNLAWRMNRFIELSPLAEPADTTVGVNESTAEAQLVLRRTGIIDVDVPISWQVVGGTSDETDLSRSGVVTIPAGQRTATLAIPIVDDSLDEANETAQVAFDSAAVGAPIPNATITIVDNDDAPVADPGTEPDPDTDPVGDPGGGTPSAAVPDVAIRAKPGDTLRGEDLLAPDATGQKVSRRVAPRRTVGFDARLTNDGLAAATFGYRVEAFPRVAVTVRDAATGRALLWVPAGGSKTLQIALDTNVARTLRIEVKVARGTPDGLRRAFRTTMLQPGDTYRDRDVALGFAKVV